MLQLRHVLYVLGIMVVVISLGTMNMRLQGYDTKGYVRDLAIYLLPLMTMFTLFEVLATHYRVEIKKR